MPDKPDHPALELQILEQWEREATFEQVRAANTEGPRFSFVDGPVTANKSLGVHTAWGRTLKDVFQRYKAMCGYHQRYQNGFDCQGLWIEVGVEQSLGLNSKTDVEAYGLAEFARRCREVVERSSRQLTEGSIRLGQWMDWDRSYFTFSDTNIEYIWRFLERVHDNGWLYQGHRATEWCPRCGTSLSAHELVGSYVDREDPAIEVRFPLVDRPGESIVIWTTTPWTLPANVAAAINPDATYAPTSDGDWRIWVSDPEADGEQPVPDSALLGRDLAGWRYHGPFDELGPGAGIEHRVVLWDEVAVDGGTGIVHIAPGCGTEDFDLSLVENLPAISPVDEAGRYYPSFGWLAGRATSEVAPDILEDLRNRDLLVSAGTIHHRFPECWRCHTPLIFRLSDDWFISVTDIREQMRTANRSVTWVPEYMGKRMDDWLVNMGDWNISRRRYYGLPLPFYPCKCGHVTVVRSKDDLAQRTVDPLDDLEELRRPWIDDVRISCEACGKPVSRVLEVGDVWLDAGIVPFSTLGWENPSWLDGGYGTGAARGLTDADLPDQDFWEEWFPADWVSEMREQIRLWFYAQLFMSVTLTGVAPFKTVLSYEKMLDETGREMHGSWGNAISAEEAFAEMGADVMRWQYCAQPPHLNLLFGFGPGNEIRRKLLTWWNSAAFFVRYASIEGFTPDLRSLSESAGSVEAFRQVETLDRWILIRTDQLVAETTAAYDEFLTVDVLRAFEDYVDDLSNWYIRLSRRRFWDGDPAALQVLWTCLAQSLRVVAPIVPFVTEHLWQRLVRPVSPEAPSSVFLSGWPEQRPVDSNLIASMATTRRVVELGRQVRESKQLRTRQPLRSMTVEGADQAAAHANLIASELRIKQVKFAGVEGTELVVRPNFRALGPRVGSDLPKIKDLLASGEFAALADGSFEVGGYVLTPEEVQIDRIVGDNLAVASADGITVAIDTELDDELLLEARVYDTIHRVNGMRKDMGLKITQRIALSLPQSDGSLLPHREWIGAETLAESVDLASSDDTIIRPVEAPTSG